AGAIARYEEAIHREPKFAMAHNNLANTLAEVGRLPEAITHYETALRLEPDYAEGHNNLASALAQGFGIAVAKGVMPRLPTLVAVQTQACAPLERAFRLSADVPLADAARHRSRFMWPWETAPSSVADGILDDETYDWWAIVEGMRASVGRPVVVGEETLLRAQALVQAHAGVRASATGTSGFAGALAAPPAGGVAVAIRAGQLQPNKFGVLEIPTTTLVEGTWFEGAACPAVKQA
ncbi:MAG: tetratricopeptide repeat protein, partial [Deltaproteobacteria bacterium]